MASIAELTREMPPQSRDRVKWAQLRELPDRDSVAPRVRWIASVLRDIVRGDTDRFVALCFAVARDGVRYVSDTVRTGGEDIAGITRVYVDPSECLDRGADDCDGKARLVVALLRGGGARARLVPWWDKTTGDLAHVSAEVSREGVWLPLESILARARVGELPQQVPTEPNGEWLY